MNHEKNYFLTQNKLIEERLNFCLHVLESRLDELSLRDHSKSSSFTRAPKYSGYSSQTYLTFRSPYIRDCRGFSGPSNEDQRQIKELTGTDNIELLIKNKQWTNEAKKQLREAVLEHYSKIHIIKLIRQKQSLTQQLESTSGQSQSDVQQNLALIEEQSEQTRARKEERIFVPEDRNDSNIDWCEISAKLNKTYHDSQDCRLMWTNQLHWSLNQGPWSKEEDTCLINAVQKHGTNDWDSVAKELNSNRLPWQCCSRYHQELIHLGAGTNPISKEDSDKILEVINLCRLGQYVPWSQVMYFIKRHNLPQVKYLWHKLSSERIVNQVWTQEEDVALLQAIEKYGDKDWNRIACCFPSRSNKSCRERYLLRLKHSTRCLGNWRRREDALLLSLIDKFGTNWSLISSKFPLRNSQQLRNRYEALRKPVQRVAPLRHKKVYRAPDGTISNMLGRKPKQTSEQELDDKLREIFATYQSVKTSSKSMVYRGVQDEQIYQRLIEVLKQLMLSQEREADLLGSVLERAVAEAVNKKTGLFAPNLSTFLGYKAWTVQQDYLDKSKCQHLDMESITSTPEYHQVLRIVVSLFFWPALLSKIKPPEVDLSVYPNLNLVDRNTKNLYTIREIQKQITKQ